MLRVRVLQQILLQVGLILAALLTIPGGSSAADREIEVRYQQRRKAAQAALEERMNARLAAGWTPTSKDEQLLSRLRALERRNVRQQELTNTRAVFEAARAEVYMQMVRHYTSFGHYRSGYVYTYGPGRFSGGFRPGSHVHDYWVLDPWAARLSAYFGNKAAQSKGIAVAQEYHANTHYERRIQNTRTRIAALQQQISLSAKLAVNVP